MGPEGSLEQHIKALAVGNVEAAFKFLASYAQKGNDELRTYKEQLESPLFRPLLSHISVQVCCSCAASGCSCSCVTSLYVVCLVD